MSTKMTDGKRVHYLNQGGVEYTLCGLALEEPTDPFDGDCEELERTEKKVNCPDCLSFIKYVKGLK